MKITSALPLLLLLPGFANAQSPYNADGYSTVPQQGNVYAETPMTFSSAGDVGITHAGLLGKRYVRSSYLQNGIDDPGVSQFDDSLQGFDIEFNTGIPWLSNGMIGTELFGKYQQDQFSGANVQGILDVGIRRTVVGGRIYAMPHPRIRPYLGLSVAFWQSDFFVEDYSSGVSLSEDDNTSNLVTNLGVEFDLLPQLSARADCKIVPHETDDGRFDGTLVWWASERFFVRGGLSVPFDDALSTGGIIGGGFAF